MRILLDECLPKDFGREFFGHTVTTVPQAGWSGIGNGKLLAKIAESNQFDLFVTVDRRLPDQNKTSNLPFSIMVLRSKSNRMAHLVPFVRQITLRINELRPGSVYVIDQSA